jgi:hypothetical protein
MEVLNTVAQGLITAYHDKVELRHLRAGDTFSLGDGVIFMVTGFGIFKDSGTAGWPCLVLYVPGDDSRPIKRGDIRYINPESFVIPIDPYSILRHKPEVLYKCSAQDTGADDPQQDGQR